MKTAVAILVVTLAGVQASLAAFPVNARVVERTRHSKVVEWERAVTNSFGQMVLQTQRYTALGTGMHRRDSSGEWVECQPVLEVQSDGTILGTGAAYRLKLTADLATASAIEILTPDQQHFRANLICLAWFDPDSGRSQTIGVVTNSRAVLELSNHRVIYANAFSDVRATVVFDYRAGRFSQSVVLEENVVPPASFGPRVRLEVISEILESPPLNRQERVVRREVDPEKRARMAEPDLLDETVRLGEMLMPPGAGFYVAGTNREPAKRIPVNKRILELDSRRLLIESIELSPAAAELRKLPPRTAGNDRSGPEPTLGRQLPAPLLARAPGGERPPVRLAQAQATPTGFLIDYELIEYEENFTFQSGLTYLIDSWADIVVGTFDRGATIKFSRYAGLAVYLGADCSGSGSGKTVFTACDDNSVGDTIAGSTNSPIGRYGYPALRLDTLDNDTQLSHFDIRYAVTGIEAGGNDTAHTLANSFIWNCDLGATAGAAYLTLDAVDFCNVTTWYSGEVSGSNLTTCADSDADGLPDSWELAWFGNLNQSGSGDYDGDGVSNLAEQQQGLSPTNKDSNSDGVIDQAFKVAVRRPTVSSIVP